MSEMSREKDFVDCSECVHYGKLECLDCEDSDLFEKMGKEGVRNEANRGGI